MELPACLYSSLVPPCHTSATLPLSAPHHVPLLKPPPFLFFFGPPPTQGKPSAGQEQPADGAAEAPPSEPEVKAKGDTEHQHEVEEEEDDEDEDEDEDERQLLGEFEKELEGILLPSDRERLRSEVKAGMERELENIIQEVSTALPSACFCSVCSRGRDRLRGCKRTKVST